MDQGNAEPVTQVNPSVLDGEPAPGEPVVTPEAEASARIEALEQELVAREAQLKRMAADFDNARRRQATEREELVKFAAERLLMNLLPIVDNFDRAMTAAKTATDIATVTQGVDMIYRQLQDVLTKSGVAAIEAVGVEFNPEMHEAVQRVPTESQPDNTVVEELQRGYLLNGKVIRPALVKVAVSG